MVRQSLISIPEIAKRHKQYKATVFRRVKRLGIAVELRVGEGTKGQKAAHISVHDYDILKPHLDGEVPGKAGTATASPVFYVILTEPDLDPGRFKVGFSTNVEDRLSSHRTSAPFSKLVKTWPCHATWERAAIDCVTEGTERLGAEMFRIDDIEGVILRGDRFFEVMPSLAVD